MLSFPFQSRTTLLITLSIFLSFLTWWIHFPCLQGNFTYDDNAALLQNNVASLRDTVWNIFTTDYWGMDIRNIHSHGSYRPLTTLTFSLSTYLGNQWFKSFTSPFSSTISSSAVEDLRSIRVGNTTILPQTGPLVNTMNIISTLPPAWEYRAVSFLIHNMVTLCCFYLNYMFSRKQIIPAFLGTVVFTVHPLLTEAICSIACRADLLAALLNVITVMLAQQYIVTINDPDNNAPYKNKSLSSSNSRKGGYTKSSLTFSTLVLFTILAILSTFAKETGIMILPVCIVLGSFHYIASFTRTYWTTETEELIMENKRSTDNDKQSISAAVNERNQSMGLLIRQRSWKIIVLSGILTLGLLVFRIVIIQGGRVPYFTVQENISIGLTGIPWFLTIMYLLSWHLGLLIYPFPLNIEWNMFSLPPVLSIYDFRNVWSLFIIGTIGILITGSLLYTLLWIYGQENMILVTSDSTRKNNARKDMNDGKGKSSNTDTVDNNDSVEPSQLPLPWLLLFSLLGILITFFPGSSLLFPVGFTIAERIMYTPAIFFSFFVTVALCLLGSFASIDHYITLPTVSETASSSSSTVTSSSSTKQSSKDTTKASSASTVAPTVPPTIRRSKSLLSNNLLFGLIILTSIVCSYHTYQRCMVWLTEESLWSSVLVTNPSSSKALYMLGVLRHNGVTPMEEAVQYYDNSLTSFENSIQLSQHPNMGVWDIAYPDPVINVVAININQSTSQPISSKHLESIVKVLRRILRPIQYPTIPNASVVLQDTYSETGIEERIKKTLIKEIHDKLSRVCPDIRSTKLHQDENTVIYNGTDFILYEDRNVTDLLTTPTSTVTSVCDHSLTLTEMYQLSIPQLSKYSIDLSRNVSTLSEGYLTMKQLLNYLQEGCVKVPWKSEYVPETWNVDTSCYFIGTIYNIPESETRLLDRLVKVGVAHMQLATYTGQAEGGYERWINDDIAHELLKAVLVLSRSSPGTSEQDSIYIHLADALMDRGAWNLALPWYDLIIRLMLKQSIGVYHKVKYSTNANEAVEGTYLQRLYDSYHNIVLSLRDLLQWKYIPFPLIPPPGVSTSTFSSSSSSSSSSSVPLVPNTVRKRYFSSGYLSKFSNASVSIKLPVYVIRQLYTAIGLRRNPTTGRIDIPYPMHSVPDRQNLRSSPSPIHNDATSFGTDKSDSSSSSSFSSSMQNIPGKFCLNLPHSTGMHRNPSLPTMAQIQDYLVATNILLQETNYSKYGDIPFTDRSGLHFECDLPRHKGTACGSILHSSIRSAWSSVAPYVEAFNRGLFRPENPVCTCQRQTSIKYQICTSMDYALPTNKLFTMPHSNLMPYFHNIQRMTNLTCQPATCARRYPDVENTDAVNYIYASHDIEHNLDLTDFTTLFAGTTTLPTAFYYAQRAQMLTYNWVHGKSTNAHDALLAGTEAISALFTICGCSGIPES